MHSNNQQKLDSIIPYLDHRLGQGYEKWRNQPLIPSNLRVPIGDRGKVSDWWKMEIEEMGSLSLRERI
jgi:hypothetical protein